MPNWRARLRGFLNPQPVIIHEQEDLLEAALELAQTQLLGQLADETSIDGRTMGVLAFLGALLAADVAAKDVLGTWWWTPLVAIALATIPCLRSTFDRDSDLGPGSLDFYSEYGGHPSALGRAQLLAELDEAFSINARRVHTKRLRLRYAIVIISVGLVVASLMIGLDRPTTIRSSYGTQGHPTAATSPRTDPGAGAVGHAARVA